MDVEKYLERLLYEKNTIKQERTIKKNASFLEKQGFSDFAAQLLSSYDLKKVEPLFKHTVSVNRILSMWFVWISDYLLKYDLNLDGARDSTSKLLDVGITPKWIEKYKLNFAEMKHLASLFATTWKDRIKHTEKIQKELSISSGYANWLAINYGPNWRKRVKALRKLHGKNWKKHL